MSNTRKVLFPPNESIGMYAWARNIYGTGNKKTTIFVGNPGCGKTAIFYSMQDVDVFPQAKEYTFIYIDAPNYTPTDLVASIPNMEEKVMQQLVSDVIVRNKKLGKPVVILIDEYGKCDKFSKSIFTRLILERACGEEKLCGRSIIMATSNYEDSGLGDTFRAHEANRLCFVGFKVSDSDWRKYQVKQNADPALVAVTVANKRFFEDYGYEPLDPVRSKYFASPRSLSSCDIDIKTYREDQNAKDFRIKDIAEDILRDKLCGSIGEGAGEELLNMVLLGNELISTEEIFENPTEAKLVDNITAYCMLISNAVKDISISKLQNNLTAFVTYVERYDDAERLDLFFSQAFELIGNKFCSRNKAMVEWFRDRDNSNKI